MGSGDENRGGVANSATGRSSEFLRIQLPRLQSRLHAAQRLFDRYLLSPKLNGRSVTEPAVDLLLGGNHRAMPPAAEVVANLA